MYINLSEEVYTFLVENIGMPDVIKITENINLVPLSNIDYRDKIKGAMVSLAIGDSFRDVTILLAESLIINQGFDPEDLANRFTRQPSSKADDVMKKFIFNYKENKINWYQCGISSLDAGAAIRGIPMALINYGDFNTSKLSSAVQTMMTHVNETAIVSSILFSTAIAYLLNTPAFSINNKENINLFIDTISKSIKGMEVKVHSIKENHKIVNLYTMVNKVLREWISEELSIEEIRKKWINSFNVLEIMPLSIYIFLKNHNDYEKAVKECLVMKENKSIGTMVLTLLGAYLGFHNIPKGYINRLDKSKEILTLSHRLFELSLKNKNNNPYRRMLNQIEVERSKDELDKLLWLGIKYNKEEAYEISIQYFEELVTKSPDVKKNEKVRLHIIEAYEGFGSKLLKKEDYREALKCFKKALIYDLNNATILCDIAVAYLNLDNLYKAEKYAQRAVEVEPEYVIGREILEGIKSLKDKS